MNLVRPEGFGCRLSMPCAEDVPRPAFDGQVGIIAMVHPASLLGSRHFMPSATREAPPFTADSLTGGALTDGPLAGDSAAGGPPAGESLPASKLIRGSLTGG